MHTLTPESIKALTSELNTALEDVNGIFQLIPLARIVDRINSLDLDASKIVGNLGKDNGHMSVPVSDDIYFVMSWYRFESGRFEIVCYATSNYDDYRTPFTAVYSAAEKNKRRRTLNRSLQNLPTYFNSKGHAFACVEAAIKDAGFDYYEFQDSTLHRYVHADNERITVHVSNNVFVTVTWYKMESGRYEIVSYAQ